MSEHHAPVEFPVHELVRRRFSPRAFANRPVPREVLRSLLEAARWAPSSYNDQPWSYIVATRENPDEFARLLSTLVPGNQKWAKDAPVLMLSVAAKNLARNGKPNRHAFHDVGAASAWLTAQATANDLFVHQMAGIDPEKARQVYHIPDTHEAVAGLAIGYCGDPNQLPEEIRQKELTRSTRKPQSEFVFSRRWGEKATF
jgi:nitroreductase